MVIKYHSAYLLQAEQTMISVLLLGQFVRELFEVVEKRLSTRGKWGKVGWWGNLCAGCVLKDMWAQWVLGSSAAGCCCQSHVKTSFGLCKRGEKRVLPPGCPPSWSGDAVCGWVLQSCRIPGKMRDDTRLELCLGHHWCVRPISCKNWQ